MMNGCGVELADTKTATGTVVDAIPGDASVIDPV